MYFIERLAYDAARGQVRSYRRSRARSRNSEWTPGAVIAVAVTFLAMWPVANLILSGHYWAVLLLVAVPCVALGVLKGVSQQGGGPGSRKVLDKYQGASGKLSDADRMRLRAEAAQDIAAARQAVFDRFGLVDPFAGLPEPAAAPEPEPGPVSAPLHLPGGLERQRLTAMLFSVPCPEPACQAGVTVPCIMGTGVPVALVDKVHVKFCHIERIALAVSEGKVSHEDVMARFGVTAPGGEGR